MDDKNICFSTSAKVILSGEHAVVYGRPALVSAINLRFNFTVTAFIREGKDSFFDKNILFIAHKVKQYLRDKKINFTDKQFNFKINSEIPIGQGLGSSAALSVAAVAALLRFYTGKDFDKEIVNNLAYQIEKYFHKNPSGVDNTAVCFGGLIYYRKEFEFLKNISFLNFKIPKKIEENLFLIDSGKPKESTAQMVEMVKIMYNKKPLYVESLLNNIEKNTKKMTLSIVKGDINLFRESLLDNEICLELLGVVSNKAKKILKNLSQYGVGKITGAGGRTHGAGFILFFADDKLKLENYLKEQRINFFKFFSDYEGLKKL
ncbi:MAG: mevalonate kinase [Patescibacteria group bacterium]|nr:mevalonate kinase [Patescibacteria group bacterium]